MGRWETGYITTGQCLQLHITAFTKYIKQGVAFLQGSTSWSTGASISVSLQKDGDRYYTILDYSKTDGGEKHPINYKVYITSVPSNLGKGEVYYFICPFSHKRCKVLYMGYGSYYFKSREAYKHRIYYASQMSSRLDKHNDTYWRLEKKLEALYKERHKTTYKGKKTRIQQRIERLEQKQEHHDYMRWQILPKALIKSMNLYGLNDAREMF